MSHITWKTIFDVILKAIIVTFRQVIVYETKPIDTLVYPGFEN